MYSHTFIPVFVAFCFILSLTSISYQQTCFGLSSDVACFKPYFSNTVCKKENTCDLPPYNSFFFGNNVHGQLDEATAGNIITGLPKNTSYPDTKILVVDIKLFENYTLFVDFNGVMYGLGDISNNGNNIYFSPILGSNGPDEKKGIKIIGDEYARGILTWNNTLFAKGVNTFNNLGLNDTMNATVTEYTKYKSDNKIVLDVDFNQYSSCKLVLDLSDQTVSVETSGLINFILQNKPDNDPNILQNYKFNHTLFYNNNEIDVQMCFVTKYRLFLLKISTGSLLIFGKNYNYEVTLPNSELITDYKCLSLNDNNEEEKLLLSHSNFICVLKSNKENIYAFGNVTTHPCLQNLTNYFDTFTPILIYRNNDYTNNLINQIEISKLNILFTLQKDGNLYACGNYNNYQSLKDHEVFKKYNLFNNIVQDNINYNPAINIGNNYFINNGKYSEVTGVKFNRIAIPRQTNKIWKFGVSKKGDSIFIIPYRSTCSGDFLADPMKSTLCIPQYKCYNVAANDTTKVCGNGRGSCVLNDVCMCDANYYGIQCELFQCHGIWNTDKSKVCSGSNGECVGYNNCKCKEGFKGNQCEINVDYEKVISKQEFVFSDVVGTPNNFISKIDLQLASTKEEYNQFITNLNSYDSSNLTLQYNLFVSGKKKGIGAGQIATLQKLNYVLFNNGSYYVTESQPTFSFPFITSQSYPGKQEIYKEGAIVTSFSHVTTSGFIYSIGTLVQDKPTTSVTTMYYCERSIVISSTAQTDPVVVSVISKLNSTTGECVWAKFIFENEETKVQVPTNIIVKEDISNNKDTVIVTIDKRTNDSNNGDCRLMAFDVPFNNQVETVRFDTELTTDKGKCSFRDVTLGSTLSGEPFIFVVGYLTGNNMTLKQDTKTLILKNLFTYNPKYGYISQIFTLNVSMSGNITAKAHDIFGEPFSLIANQNTNEYYLAGFIYGTFSDGTSYFYGRIDGIIRKLSHDQQLVWEIRFGSYENQIVVKNMFLDRRGELHVNGFYKDKFTYNNTVFKVLENSQYNTFIMRLDSNNGNLLWSTYFTNSTQDIQITNIVEDAVGNLILGSSISSSFTTEDGKTMFDGITGTNSLLTFYSLQCYHNRFGALCQNFNCHGFNKNDKKRVCNGKGLCIAPNHCECSISPGYEGFDCSQFTCFGKFHQDWGNVCSGRGQCVALNVCKCNDGYYGEKCEYFKCFGNENDYLNIQNVNGGRKALPSMANVLCQKLNRMRK